MQSQPARWPASGVIDVTTVVLGPMASQILGDMGADVIKVETNDGDSTALYRAEPHAGHGQLLRRLNRNKRSLAIDLKKPAARAALLRLIETADVFVHNMRPARQGGSAWITPLGRRSIRSWSTSAASGFRKDSSMQEFPAYDDLIQGMSGTAALNAGADGAPRYVPTVLVDKLTGSDPGVDDRHGAVPSRTHRLRARKCTCR